MLASQPTKKQYKDRIKLPMSFETNKMLAEFEELKLAHFEYYDVISLRGPAHLIDPSRPFPPPADDYADGSWTEWLDSPYLTRSEYLKSIVDYFRANTKVTLVRLLRLAPKALVAEHTDPTLGLEIHKSVIRLTIPIVKSTEVDFYLNNEIVPMKPGECWYMRLTDPHRINNRGETERINLTIDMIPNEWVVNMIENE